MHQPEGFAVPGHEGQVYHMKCSLYGFMQSGRNWAEHLNESLGALKWIRSRADPAICIHITDAGTSIVGVYMDDMQGISTTTAAAVEAQAGVKSVYDVTDVLRTATVLGMTIEYDKAAGILSISSRPYLERVLEHYRMSDCNAKSTLLPIDAAVTASKDALTDADCAFMADKPYCEAVGSLQHTANTTCPDLAFSVSRLATCVSNPQPQHWKNVQHVLAYVKGSLDYKITH
jgi:hypothetical protein